MRYLELIADSDKTPESKKESERGAIASLFMEFGKVAQETVNMIQAEWGEENFSTEETSSENEMSIVQYANLCEKKILLTGDAGRGALTEASEYAPNVNLYLPGIDRFQVPHHGSRRNLSSELLDTWLGEKLPERPNEGTEYFTGIVSASEKDEDHPRNVVRRAIKHRGGEVYTNEEASLRSGFNAPARAGWSSANPLPYPEKQEE